jgi:pimeloyl-ACP methyl ester carboxylesterase
LINAAATAGIESVELVEIAGLRTRFIAQGSGYPVVLLHGQWSTASVAWSENIPALAAHGFRAYAVDQPGFGETENPEDYSIETRIEHVKAFIDFLGLNRLACWGCSDGSYVAASIALTDQRIDRLILMASGALAPPRSQAPESTGDSLLEELKRYTPTRANAYSILSRILANHERLDDELVDRALGATAGKNLKAHRARMVASPPDPIHESLSRLDTPVLLLWGLDDEAVSPEQGLTLLRAMRTAEMHLLHRCGHWPQIDRAERVNELVCDFLSSSVHI